VEIDKMTISRYKDLDILANGDLDYKKSFKSQFGNKSILRHYETQEMPYPTSQEISGLDFANHIWKSGDRYYKLAHHFYGDSRYWWIIAFFNKKPTEQHMKIGDLVKIPMPLRQILDIYGL
tara:strand:+ start:357 stop:719 length:363 start_codon:yes stop_codon:yes gene_type:complete